MSHVICHDRVILEVFCVALGLGDRETRAPQFDTIFGAIILFLYSLFVRSFVRSGAIKMIQFKYRDDH